MIRAIYSSISGLISQLTKKDTTANNIANINTTGYKSSRVDLAENAKGGVEVDATNRMMTQGPIKVTGNPFDLAIEGNGYFQVSMPDGNSAYTRAGNFSLDSKTFIIFRVTSPR